jgi:hypothetical protein
MHSSDDPSSHVSAESEASAGSPPNRSPENAAEQDRLPVQPSPQGEQRRPRRRRRRHHRPSSAVESATAQIGGETQAEGMSPAADAVAPETPPDPAPAGEVQKPRRRRRRRPRPPRETLPSQAPLEGEGQIAADAAVGNTSADVPPADPTELRASGPNIFGEQRRRRRRRRRPPREGEITERHAEDGTPEATASVSESGAQQAAAAVTRPRSGGAWNRRPREAGSGEREPRFQRPRDGHEREARSHDSAARGRDRREQSRQDRGARDRGQKHGRPERGRGAPPKKPEVRLYALESIVDRGFEDVTDEGDGGSTRRVHWTIVKRTVADQKSGKAMSAIYVLQREGTDSEFPNLGVARAAVNKTIVHPEKLTLSKAEHAAAKK